MSKKIIIEVLMALGMFMGIGGKVEGRDIYVPGR